MRGGYPLCSALDLPSSPASSPPHNLHGRLLNLFGIVRGEYGGFQGVVWRTTRRSCPGSVGPLNDPQERLLNVGAPHRYHTHSSDTCDATCSPRTPAICFIAPWTFPLSSPASSPPHDLHGRLPNLFGILRGKYNRFQGVVRSPTTYNSTILPRLGRAA